MNILGIDFEDWYHPQLIQPHIQTKEKKPSVINGIDKILDFLRKHDVYATFFVVGELLEYKKDLLDQITENGHEIAFHTMYHTRLDTDGFQDKFENEVIKFNELTDGKSKGFRAPTFSLNTSTSWIIDILVKHGYVYDSSVMPAKTKMYGIENAETKPYKISNTNITNNDPNGKLIEFPLLITKFLGKTIPAAGGFYLRTLPLKVIMNAIRNSEKTEIPACFYVHSWELTPEFMPKIDLPFMDSFVTYHNLDKTMERMKKILEKFKFTSFEKYIPKMKL